MKNKYQKILIGALCACCITATMVGCTNKDEVNQPNTEKVTNTVEKKVVSQELLKYLPKDTNNTYFYTGDVEYGHALNVDSVEQSEERVIYNFKGNIETNSTIKDPSESFFINMTVDSDKITLESDYAWMPLKKYTALSLPTEQDKSWTEMVTIDGKEYEAASTIISIEDTVDGQIVNIETVVDGVKGYENDKYVQHISFREDLGIFKLDNDYLFKDYTNKMVQRKSEYRFSGVANR